MMGQQPLRNPAGDRGSVPAHTPGPWHVTIAHVSGHTEIGVDDWKDNFICTMHSLVPTNNEANARLIAAAPDMLAALKDCADYIEAILTNKTGFAAEEIFDAARAAIAKATGEPCP